MTGPTGPGDGGCVESVGFGEGELVVAPERSVGVVGGSVDFVWVAGGLAAELVVVAGWAGAIIDSGVFNGRVLLMPEMALGIHVRLPWIFSGAPFIINGTPKNILVNLTAMVGVYKDISEGEAQLEIMKRQPILVYGIRILYNIRYIQFIHHVCF